MATKSSPGADRIRWILDDGPFDDLATTKPANLGTYSTGLLLIAPTTEREASRSSARKRLLEAERSGGEQVFQVFDVLLAEGDPVGETFLELHGGERTPTNRAEMEAIAWALHEARDAVFVTADLRASMTALAELGRGRVAHPFDLWIELLQAEALTPADFEALCTRTWRKDQGLVRIPSRIQKPTIR